MSADGTNLTTLQWGAPTPFPFFQNVVNPSADSDLLGTQIDKVGSDYKLHRGCCSQLLNWEVSFQEICALHSDTDMTTKMNKF